MSNSLFQNLRTDLFVHLNKTGTPIWRVKRSTVGFFAFKSIFQTEKYLTIIADKWQRLNYTRFRLRTLGFNANKRWFQPGTSTDLPCPLCGYHTDDEKHFLFQCTAYDSIREKNEVFELDITRRQDFVSLLTSSDDSIIRGTAKFIAEAQKIRRKQNG